MIVAKSTAPANVAQPDARDGQQTEPDNGETASQVTKSNLEHRQSHPEIAYKEPTANQWDSGQVLKNETTKDETTSRPPQYLSGAHLYLALAGLYFATFLAQLEISVVITALVSITNDLEDYANATWVVNAYLLTWSGFLVLWSQFGKVLGRRPCLALASILFIVFSAACAGAQTMVQLIIFRAFQGVGGAGVYNLAIVMICESVPLSSLPKVTAFMSLSVGTSFAFGPLIGGAIASSTTWRWVFIINVPCGIAMLIFCMITIPSGFPHHYIRKEDRPSIRSAPFSRLDYLGATLFLAFAIFLITALQEGSTEYSWNSPVIIALLILSGVCMICFVLWQRNIYIRSLSIEPMLSWSFVRRKPLGLLSTALVMGVPYTTSFVQIPEQFQVLNGLSAFDAGKRLIAYILMVPAGILIGTVLVGKLKLSFTVSCLIGATLQLIAAVCFALLPFGRPGDPIVPPRQYVQQVLLGLGSGISSAVGTATLPAILDGDKDLMAPLSGANTQFRFTGGAIGLGIITAALNADIRPRLASILNPSTVASLLQSTETLALIPAESRLQVLQIFADGFQLQWKIVAGICGLQFLTCLLAI